LPIECFREAATLVGIADAPEIAEKRRTRAWDSVLARVLGGGRSVTSDKLLKGGWSGRPNITYGNPTGPSTGSRSRDGQLPLVVCLSHGIADHGRVAKTDANTVSSRWDTNLLLVRGQADFPNAKTVLASWNLIELEHTLRARSATADGNSPSQ
jgi:hypothetical protein